jgi:N-acetylmuramoyl-L-alanine amidase
VEAGGEAAEAKAVEPLNRVRAGIFADKANADALAAKLAAAGFTPSVSQVDRSGRTMYLVQLGAFRNRENAEELVRALRQAGFEAIVTTEN